MSVHVKYRQNGCIWLHMPSHAAATTDLPIINLKCSPSGCSFIHRHLLFSLHPTTTLQLRIKAGPGSGKTRVVTARVAWLLQQQLTSPANILVITFTNKAANELKVWKELWWLWNACSQCLVAFCVSLILYTSECVRSIACYMIWLKSPMRQIRTAHWMPAPRPTP